MSASSQSRIPMNKFFSLWCSWSSSKASPAKTRQGFVPKGHFNVWKTISFNEPLAFQNNIEYNDILIELLKKLLWLFINDIEIQWIEWNAEFYCQPSNIMRTLVGNKIVDHTDVVGASPVGTAPTTSSFLTSHLASMDWAKTTAIQDEKHLSFGIWCHIY